MELKTGVIYDIVERDDSHILTFRMYSNGISFGENMNLKMMSYHYGIDSGSTTSHGSISNAEMVVIADVSFAEPEYILKIPMQMQGVSQYIIRDKNDIRITFNIGYDNWVSVILYFVDKSTSRKQKIEKIKQKINV